MGAGPSRLFGPRSRIWDLDCQQETSRVASASGDGTVRIWETEQEGRCLAVLGGVANGDTGGGDVYSVRWGKSGKVSLIVV
jgi:WD40 repeat protein